MWHSRPARFGLLLGEGRAHHNLNIAAGFAITRLDAVTRMICFAGGTGGMYLADRARSRDVLRPPAPRGEFIFDVPKHFSSGQVCEQSG